MRIDPSAVFAHTVASLPGKLLLVFMAIFIGALLPSYLGSRGDFTSDLGWQLLAFIAVMPVIACSSGWWALIAIPLFLLLLWRIRDYLHYDHSLWDLYWITLLSCAVMLRTSQDRWLYASSVLGALALLGWYFQKVRAGGGPGRSFSPLD